MKESNAEIQIPEIMKLVFCVVLMLLGTISYAQQCDYSTGIIRFNATGGNNTNTYTTSYVLTDQMGRILDITTLREFQVLTEGFYSIYAVNYKTTSNPEGLITGENVSNITGTCVDVSAPFSITICGEIDNCEYCFGEDVVLNPEDGNTDPSFTTEYFLTDNSGEILVITDTPTFSDLEEGSYAAFAINYDASKGLTGFVLGGNITDINGLCFDIGPASIFGICQTLDPTIFFDLKGCDITQTALLQVGEQYDSYLWNTGSTKDFIIIDAEEVATYRVTVSLASGCQGIVEQKITGEEISTIGDFVFEDLDGNGLQDPSDPGINGITVNLYADFNRDGKPDFAQFPSCTTVTKNHPDTGEPGYYIFHVYRSNYVVEFVAPNGYEMTLQNEGSDSALDSDADDKGFTGSIGVLSNEFRTDVDAGMMTTSGAGGLVWHDEDGDGVRDDEEIGLNDVVVNLYSSDGQLVATTVSLTDPETGQLGFYCFDNLVLGTYYTEIEMTEGFVLSPANATGDGSRDSNADESNGPNTTGFFNANPGQKTTAIDFGIYPGATICGLVWRDSIRGVPGIYEPGVDMVLEGTQVDLFSQDLGQIVMSVNTDDGGRYCFTDITLGSYNVQFFGAALPTFVQPNVGDDPLVNSDVNTTTGMTPVFFVSPADTILGLNAGITQDALPVVLSNFDGYWDRSEDLNILNWTTSNEINNDYFSIERAIGKNGGFFAIGRVDGNGNSSEPIDYSFQDADIASSGTYYYRLRQVDFDGAFEFSNIVAIDVERNKSLEWRVYPNPVKDRVNISVSVANSAIGSARLTDITGRVIKNWDLGSVEKGQSNISLTTAGLSQGTYFLSIKVGTREIKELIQIMP